MAWLPASCCNSRAGGSDAAAGEAARPWPAMAGLGSCCLAVSATRSMKGIPDLKETMQRRARLRWRAQQIVILAKFGARRQLA